MNFLRKFNEPTVFLCVSYLLYRCVDVNFCRDTWAMRGLTYEMGPSNKIEYYDHKY